VQFSGLVQLSAVKYSSVQISAVHLPIKLLYTKDVQ